MPKASKVYRTDAVRLSSTTPSGSNIHIATNFYKPEIPSGFVQTKSTLKGSTVYRMNIVRLSSTTPKGSHNSSVMNFYKPEIPTGLNTKQHYAAK
jgi:hypothetical protein